MHTKLLFLVGAGGHGRVVLDAILLNGFLKDNIRVTDSSDSLRDSMLLGYPIQVPATSKDMSEQLFHLAIGNSKARESLFVQLKKLSAYPQTILHPMASISQFSKIDDGVFVAAKAVVAPNALLGQCTIVNHGAIVDHDCIVGKFSHVAPNATLAGGVTIGSHVLIGAGANVLPGITIGDHAVIGAGAVVTENVNAGETRVGVPAILKTRS
ncbi:MAG: acetyltransferase [Cellvibrio sp.]|nr:acetyltransferase [Cellvibrio sp.]